MFREATSRHGGKVVAADASPLASGLYLADERTLLPRFGTPDFWDHVNGVIQKFDIGAIVPTRDAELAGWALQARSGKLKAKVVLSPAETLALCHDKLSLAEQAERAGVLCPRTEPAVTGGNLPATRDWPVVLKPRRGAGSRGVRVVSTPGLYCAEVEHSEEELLRQAYVKGPEFTVDAYAAEGGELAAAVVRRRLSVRDGQSDIGETVRDEELSGLAQKLARSIPFRGAINLQFIRGPEGPRMIDVNPRFSGGIAITRAAGMDFADWTVRELSGKSFEIPRSYRLVTFLGYSDGVALPSELLRD
jgi:carbamoyl-phosphate synthase large subunit